MCVCVCVCVWGGGGDTLSYESSTNSLEDVYRIVSISSTAISVFRFVWSIYLIQFGMPKGGGGGVVGK